PCPRTLSWRGLLLISSRFLGLAFDREGVADRRGQVVVLVAEPLARPHGDQLEALEFLRLQVVDRLAVELALEAVEALLVDAMVARDGELRAVGLRVVLAGAFLEDDVAREAQGDQRLVDGGVLRDERELLEGGVGPESAVVAVGEVAEVAPHDLLHELLRKGRLGPALREEGRRLLLRELEEAVVPTAL